MALSAEEITKLQQVRPDVFQNSYYAANPDQWMKKYGTKEGVNLAGPATPAVDPNAQLNALRSAYMASLTASPEEQEAETSLKNLISSKELGLAQIEDTSKNPVAMAFIQGQQGAVEKSAALKALPLQTRLAALQAKRQSAMDVNKFAYETEAGLTKDRSDENWRNKEFNEQVRQFNVQFKQSKKDKKSASKASKSTAKASASKAQSANELAKEKLKVQQYQFDEKEKRTKEEKEKDRKAAEAKAKASKSGRKG